MGSERRYIFLMFSVAIVVTALGCLVPWLYNVLPCEWHGYMPGRYLSYCDADQFGDFEHAALYFETEPGATAAMRAADVIILGNSRTQYAFSTEAVETFFANRNLKFYALGFNYGENMLFARALMDRLHLQPKILIINTDTAFFREDYSTPSFDLLKETRKAWARAWLIHSFEAVHESICSNLPIICRPWARRRSIYRSIENGEWIWHGTFADADKVFSPVNPIKQMPEAPETLAAQITRAKQFLIRLGIDKKCVVLTGVPNSFTQSEEWATEIAAAIGVNSVAPVVDGLFTMDSSHLNQPSAERWSTQFLAGYGPFLDACLNP